MVCEGFSCAIWLPQTPGGGPASPPEPAAATVTCSRVHLPNQTTGAGTQLGHCLVFSTGWFAEGLREQRATLLRDGDGRRHSPVEVLGTCSHP